MFNDYFYDKICHLGFTNISLLLLIYSLFTFHFSLFSSFYKENQCKYKNLFVILHPKSEKSFKLTQKS